MRPLFSRSAMPSSIMCSHAARHAPGSAARFFEPQPAARSPASATLIRAVVFMIVPAQEGSSSTPAVRTTRGSGEVRWNGERAGAGALVADVLDGGGLHLAVADAGGDAVGERVGRRRGCGVD